MLRNRVYLGEAVHKGKSYPGEHEPILDRVIWDRVHAVLSTNGRQRARISQAKTPAPLRGLMRCTHCDRAMTPTRTRGANGKAYRYYLCLGAMRRGHDGCPIGTVAASEIEGVVLAQVRRLLNAPEVVARAIAAVHREGGPSDDPVAEEKRIMEAIASLQPIWDELYPAEQNRILRLLIERIDVAVDGISITLHTAGIRSLAIELGEPIPAAAASTGRLTPAEGAAA